MLPIFFFVLFALAVMGQAILINHNWDPVLKKIKCRADYEDDPIKPQQDWTNKQWVDWAFGKSFAVVKATKEEIAEREREKDILYNYEMEYVYDKIYEYGNDKAIILPITQK